MLLGFCLKIRWGSGVLLCLISLGFLVTEIHGILGHKHGERTRASNYIKYSRAPSGFQLVSLKGDNEDPFCNICFYRRLLRHTLIPATACPVDSFSVVQAISIQRICLPQSDTPQEENRGPPLA